MSLVAIVSPLPGTFYTQATPQSPLFKQPGDAVVVGDVIGLVEVMKQFGEIQAEATGRFEGYRVSSGAAVEPGQTLAEISVD